jgi:quercetin dioxygenase-like cupin family protein
VRVLDVRLKPGDRTVMHSHPKNIVCVLAESVIKFTALGVKERIVRNKAGSAIWVEAGSHSTENVGNTESHNIVVELKG